MKKITMPYEEYKKDLTHHYYKGVNRTHQLIANSLRSFLTKRTEEGKTLQEALEESFGDGADESKEYNEMLRALRELLDEEGFE